MPVLHHHHILPLFVWVDDAVASTTAAHQTGGRPSILRDSEVITILVFNLFACQQQTIRQVYDWTTQYHAGDFPKLPNYQNFLKHCHRIIPALASILDSLLMDEAELRFMDSTMLEVCRLVRRKNRQRLRPYRPQLAGRALRF